MSDDGVRRLLVFRRGHIGDTVIALPAFWALRAHVPRAELTLLCDRSDAPSAVNAADVAMGTGLFADRIEYPTVAGDRPPGAWSMARLALTLRRRRFDAVAYLAPSLRSAAHVRRDTRFFAWSGIRRVLGGVYPDADPPRAAGEPLAKRPHEADRLLARLAESGVAVPASGAGRMDLAISDGERSEGARLLGDSGGRPRIAIGPGSKMAAKVWPEDRYRDTVSALIASHDVEPVVIGGPEDRVVAGRLIAAWGRGRDLCGVGLRQAVAAMERCRLYLGNDTGSMHLAVCASLRCVALFSARDQPGKWYPYGDGHAVLRRAVPCEGCMLTVCEVERMRCLTLIGVEEAATACRGLLGSTG
jgi:ADP-heptose:LPS heptosyltransferase